MNVAEDWPDGGNDGLIDAILAIPANRERFVDAIAHALATEAEPDDPREIERRLHVLRK